MEANQYTPKTRPFAHQQREFDEGREVVDRALWWEQGTGKTKAIVDLAGHLYTTGRIDSVLVLAPEGVAANWIRDEFPAHLSDAVRCSTFLWRSSKSKQVGFQRDLEKFTETSGPLRVLAMTYDAVMTKPGAKAARKLLCDTRCLYVLDEATRIKSPNAKTTKRVLASSAYAKFRRVLNGTPVEDSPFQAYAQVKFLDERAWAHLGITRFEHFKATFGEWIERRTWQGGNERTFQALTRYRNLDKLTEVLQKVGTRVRKSDVLDLPPKVYSRVYFELSPEQRRLYDDLASEYVAWFGDGARVTAELAIVRLTRMQQICSGYLPSDDEKLLRPIGEKNPRIAALMSALEDVSGSFIVWAKYDVDIDAIKAALDAEGISAVTYDGRVGEEDRYQRKKDFQEKRVRAFIAKPSAAGVGLTLTAATTVIYYNNSFSGQDRQQSEDRAHRIGQTESVRYVDLVASDTVDERILEILRAKRDTAEVVMGDLRPNR